MSSIWYISSWIYNFIWKFPYHLYSNKIQRITYPNVTNIEQYEKKHGLLMDRKYIQTRLEDGSTAILEQDEPLDPSISLDEMDETLAEIQEDFISDVERQIEDFIVIRDPDEIYIDKEVESGLNKFIYVFVPKNVNVMEMYMMVYACDVNASISVSKPNPNLDIYHIQYETVVMKCNSWWHRYNNTLYTHNPYMMVFFEEKPELAVVTIDNINRYASN